MSIWVDSESLISWTQSSDVNNESPTLVLHSTNANLSEPWLGFGANEDSDG